MGRRSCGQRIEAQGNRAEKQARLILQGKQHLDHHVRNHKIIRLEETVAGKTLSSVPRPDTMQAEDTGKEKRQNVQ